MDLIQRSPKLGSQAEKVSVPLCYADELCALRSNVNLVKNKLAAA